MLTAIALDRRPRFLLGASGLAALASGVIFLYSAPTARARVQGVHSQAWGEVLHIAEGPDSTVWVTVADRSDARKLVIDGFEASGEDPGSEHYMRWMGYLPALATPRLDRALVICFGTGQTADAVRELGPRHLEIAEVSAAVLDAAPWFPSNRGVLRDPRVTAHVTDGRALLRRARDRRYDVITLEPMPPNFAGANHLYSREFYRLARSRLTRHGAVAQWLPLHLVARPHAQAIIATFVEAFPHSRLWIDPAGGTAILVGAAQPWTLRDPPIDLDLSAPAITAAFALDSRALSRLAAGATPITDDNQLLSYGHARFTRGHNPRGWWRRLYGENVRWLSARSE
jgi:spermidine synthase